VNSQQPLFAQSDEELAGVGFGVGLIQYLIDLSD
jgi:hypothetical protein